MSKLNELMKEGEITVEGNQYIGYRTDNSEVILGLIGSEAEIEKYLTQFPTPDEW